MEQSIENIEKEAIHGLTFVKASSPAPADLISKLQNAEKLGNAFKSKVTIVFETLDGIKKTETTVWNTTSDYIQLKAGIMIPIYSIIDISI